jgi:hypothetical protein
MSGLNELVRELRANWDQQNSARAEWEATYDKLEAKKTRALTKRDHKIKPLCFEARRLLHAARERVPPDEFELWCVLNLKHPLWVVREYLRTADRKEAA